MSIVYAIETVGGMQGTLVDAFGVYSNPMISVFMNRVAFRLHERAPRARA